MQQDRTELLGPLISPVLKRLFDEIGERHDHSPQVPEPHHHIVAGDRLDRAEFTFYYYLVLDSNWLCHCDLDPGEQVAQNGRAAKLRMIPRRSSRGEQTNPILSDRVEGHQSGGGCDD